MASGSSGFWYGGSEERGAIFVESEQDVPEGAICVLSAHGVAPAVYTQRDGAQPAHGRRDTCPLVTKVHKEARRFAKDGYTIFLVGHATHEEVVGTMGEAPNAITLVESVDDVPRSTRPIPSVSPT